MKITKIFHSCVLVEDEGVKILIDPGAWVFGEKYAKFSDFSDVDAILVTHEHQDHYYPEALREINKPIITNKSLAQKMKEEGLDAKALLPGTETVIKNISVRALDCPHGALPVPCPENSGFIISKRRNDASLSIFAPGDSLALHKEIQNIEILLAPVIAPWMRVAEGIDYVRHVKPKATIPVHEGFMKYPFALNLFVNVLTEAGFNIQAKDPGMSFEII